MNFAKFLRTPFFKEHQNIVDYDYENDIQNKYLEKYIDIFFLDFFIVNASQIYRIFAFA